MKPKNPTTLKRGSIASAVLAAGSLVARIAVGAEMNTIKNGHAAIVVMGGKQMSRSDYLAYAAKMNTALTILLVVLALAAAGLYMMYQKSKKQ